MRRYPVALFLVLLLVGNGARAETFAQHSGFAQWFRAHPPAPNPPSDEDRALLHRYRPVLHVPPDAPGPIDFYRDYIGHGVLRAGGDHHDGVDRELLAAHADDPAAVFTHHPPERTPRRLAYGRVDRAPLEPFGTLTFLTWHFVFRHSGLPTDLPGWQEALARLLGDPEDWHQLDHYTAATLVLAPGRQPLGLILQQHNHLRAYWFGRDLELPEDGRVRLSAASRSNELYPRPERSRLHGVVRFLEAGNLDWLAGGNGSRPLTGTHDRVIPGRAVDYRLAFLPPTDPFYRFQGKLGAERLLPGRDGPPGADYKTLPAFLDRSLQFCAFRWPAGAGPSRLKDLRRLLADPADAEARAALFERCRAFIRDRLGDPVP